MRARCLRELEQADAVATAARTSVLSVFAAGQDYADDGDYSPCSWLIHRTQVTKGTAVDHAAWVKRGAGHPAVMAALAAQQVSKSYAREICWWTDKLPEDSRQAADEILLGAAASGLELADLAGLAAEMFERSRQDKPDADPGDGRVARAATRAPTSTTGRCTLATTLGGAGVIHGALTPECAEFVQTVLDALSAPTGADDDRTHEQRYHDGLQEAMRRLIAAGLAPRQGGQPIRVWAYVSLADLMQLEGSAELAAEWMSRLAAQWAGHRAAAAEAGGHQGLWLDGAAAQGVACGVPVTPVVTGNVNPAAFDDLIRLCAQLDKLLHAPGEHQPARTSPARTMPRTRVPDATADPDRMRLRLRLKGPSCRGRPWRRPSSARPSSCCPVPAGWPASCAARPACGWAAQPAAGHRLQRDRPGPHPQRGPAPRRGTASGPAAAASPRPPCEVHHTKHKADGGHTSLTGCVLLCAATTTRS